MSFEFRQGYRAVRNTLLNLHPMEIKVRDATSNDGWGASGSLKRTIADATYNFEEYRIVMDTVWKRMNDSGKNYRHVYKSLQLLEFLVTHGAERCIDEAKDSINTIRTLKHFQYIDENGKDQGVNIRELSKKVAKLLSDDHAIAEEREKAQQITARIQGFQTGRPSTGGRYTTQRTAPRHSTPAKKEESEEEEDDDEESGSEEETESDSEEEEEEEETDEEEEERAQQEKEKEKERERERQREKERQEKEKKAKKKRKFKGKKEKSKRKK
eukprot:gb/GECH01011829.1/.p1 GENE.gb/GECH01011829.1/~~gb/GECH01011829.1/.p1  ORF type:complete len:270 (+),score=112.50 gb/GECH01011829.1/:1-810(+)